LPSPLVGQTSLLVYAFSGHPWQVEMHFYYFAVLAMLSGFCDWRVLLLAAGLIAIHHAGLNEFLPSAVYPGGSNFARVAVHAVIVVVETAMLIGIGYAIRSAFEAARRAHGEAAAAAAQLEGIASSARATWRPPRYAPIGWATCSAASSARWRNAWRCCTPRRQRCNRTPKSSARQRLAPAPSRCRGDRVGIDGDQGRIRRRRGRGAGADDLGGGRERRPIMQLANAAVGEAS